jgi:hypothetical protein
MPSTRRLDQVCKVLIRKGRMLEKKAVKGPKAQRNVRTLWADVGIPGMRCHGSSLQEQGERRKEESLCIGG